jgi:hypothetical protein
MPDTTPAKSEGIEQYIPLVAPVIITLAVVYFLFLAPQQDQINGARNDLAASNLKIDNLTTSKVSIGDNDGKFSLISLNFSEVNTNMTFFESKLKDFLARLIPIEQNTSQNTVSIAGLNQHFITTDGNIASLFTALSSANASYATNFTSLNGNITDLQTQLNLFRNSTYFNYTDMLDWATSLDIKITAMNTTLNNFMQTYLNSQAVMQNQTDALNVTIQKICVANPNVCN